MKFKTFSQLIPVPLISAVITGASPAADYWWNGPSEGAWNTPANWSTSGSTYTAASTFPTAADAIHFNLQSVTDDQTLLFEASRSVRALRFNSPGATLFQGNGSSRTLTIGGDGSLINPDTETILIAEGAGPVTYGAPQASTSTAGISTRIQASQTWTNNSTSLFTVLNSIASSATSGTQVLTISGSGNTTLGSTTGIQNGTGTLALTKSGSGTLRLNNANGYSGATRIEGGTFVAGVIGNGGAHSSVGASSSASSNLVLNGGTLQWTGGGNSLTDRGFTVESGGGTLQIVSLGITLRFAGVVTGSGTLTKTGTGFLSLSNNENDFTGKLVVSQGRLSIRASGALGVGGSEANGTEVAAGAEIHFEPEGVGGTGVDSTWNDWITLNGGGLRNVNRANTLSGNITLGQTSTISVVGGSTLTSTGVISGNGGLTKNEPGTLHMNNANSYTGVTTLNSGVTGIKVLADGGRASGLGASSAASANLVFNGGTLFINDSENVGSDRGFTLGENGGTIRKDSNIVRFGGVVTGAGELRKTGNGVLALSNSGNDFTGRIVINGGAVEARSANALGTSGGIDNGVLVNGGTFLRLDPNGTSGAATDVTWNETVVLNGGTLYNRTRNNSWNGAVILQNHSTISAEGTSSLNVTSGVSETVAATNLTKAGGGTVTFSNINSFTGSTRVNSGTLVAASAGGFNTSTSLELGGGTFQLGANEVFNDLATLALSGGTLDTNHYNETIGGAVSLTADSFISLSGNSVLRLGASSTEIWAGMLSISEWNGLVLGGGDDQIYFGDNASALTSDQVGRIVFVDPTGFTAGTYDALILATGEIVPGSVIPEASSLLLVAVASGLTLRRRRNRQA
jgi:fibronectin-binding autotransporter adhesin